MDKLKACCNNCGNRSDKNYLLFSRMKGMGVEFILWCKMWDRFAKPNHTCNYWKNNSRAVKEGTDG